MSTEIKLTACCDTCTGQREGMQRLLYMTVEELDKRYYNDAGQVVCDTANRLLKHPARSDADAAPRVKARAKGEREVYRHMAAKYCKGPEVTG